MTLPPLNPTDLTERLKGEATRLGFDLVGVAPAVVPPGYGRYRDWLATGREAGMAYLRDRADAREHPASVLPGVRSVVVVGMVYGEAGAAPLAESAGRVARYARGADYHDLLWRRLDALLAWFAAERPGTVGRAVCDTAPLLERDFAQLAGLGWIGRNTCLISRRAGSFTVLGSLLLDQELAYDAPLDQGYCGTCTRCLDACPTEALDPVTGLDARLCLSYWTIEHRGPIAASMADRLGDWVFGCDICQEVCPWNRKAPSGREPALAARPDWTDPDLITWLDRDPAEFRRALKGTALARTKRVGLVRNAALVLGGRGVARAVPALARRLLDPAEEAVVRQACAWALGRIGTAEAHAALGQAARAGPELNLDPATRAALGSQEAVVAVPLEVEVEVDEVEAAVEATGTAPGV